MTKPCESHPYLETAAVYAGEMRNLGAIAVLCLCLACFSCAPWSGPLLTCPESIAIGEEIQLSASQVDDALWWRVDEEDPTDAVFVLPDGTESIEARTSNIGDSRSVTGTTNIGFRAAVAGTRIVRVIETTIGPGIGMPRPMGTASCSIGIREASE